MVKAECSNCKNVELCKHWDRVKSSFLVFVKTVTETTKPGKGALDDEVLRNARAVFNEVVQTELAHLCKHYVLEVENHA